MPDFDVITFSDMCVDLIISGEDVIPQFGQVEKLVNDYTLELGGSCNIFACQSARLGLRTAVVGRVGDDMFGKLILTRLAECGVDTRFVSVDPALKTGIGVALCPPGDRAILTYMGTINAVFPADITEAVLNSTRHIHHGSYYLHTNLRPAMAAVFQRARQKGITTSLDTNWDPAEQWDSEVIDILKHTNLFMPNEQEARHISRRNTVDEAARRFLEWGVQVVAVKAGEKGSRVYTPQRMYEKAVEPATGGDSIGAGDSYDAGFLIGWLRGLPIERCLDLGTACGRSVASKIGGLAGQLRWEEAINDKILFQ